MTGRTGFRFRGRRRQRRGPESPRTGQVVVSVLLALLLAGCSSSSPDATTTPSAPGAGPATPGASSSPVSPARTSTSAGSSDQAAKVAEATALKANDALTASLYSLAQSLKKLQSDNSLAQLRRGLSTISTSARITIKRQRSAAYPSATRNCAAVRSAATQVEDVTAQGEVARQKISARITLLDSDLAALSSASAKVSSRRNALAKVLKGLRDPPATAPSSGVTSALKDATDRRTEMLAAIKAVSSASANAGKTLSKIRSQSNQIRSDACP